MTDSEHVVHDYAATSLSLKAHPVSFVREKLSLLRITPNAGLASVKLTINPEINFGMPRMSGSYLVFWSLNCWLSI